MYCKLPAVKITFVFYFRISIQFIYNCHQLTQMQTLLKYIIVAAKSGWKILFQFHTDVFEGHHRSCVTDPLYACVCLYIPYVPDQHGNIRQFSGQGMEKSNDDAKRHYYSGNRHNALLETFYWQRLEWRSLKEILDPTCIRQKKEYTKRNSEYWEKTILETRKRPCLDEEHEQWIIAPVVHVAK